MIRMRMMFQEEHTNMMNMMYGLSGWWLIGMGMMVLFWIAIILLVIWVVRSLFPREMRSGHDQALETLQQRYAKGEINAAEYEQARARLEQIPIT
jgi:putative membrane protein